MLRWGRWVLGVLVAAVVVGVPIGYHRAGYVHAKRLRVVADGKLYRCGQLPVEGFQEAFDRFGIKTVINLQEEAPDPLLPRTWLDSWRGRPVVRESEVCAAAGVKFVALPGGVLDARSQDAGGRPAVIDDYLAVLRDPVTYPPPYLIHCHAGRDRTGLFVAVYRMEFEGRTKAEAVRELRANGFATFAATDGNVYLEKFVLRYETDGRPKGGEK